MTVHEFFEQMGVTAMPSSDSTIWQTLEIWSNYAAEGYALLAMQNAGFTSDQMQAVVTELRRAFEQTSVDEAAQVFATSPY